MPFLFVGVAVFASFLLGWIGRGWLTDLIGRYHATLASTMYAKALQIGQIRALRPVLDPEAPKVPTPTVSEPPAPFDLREQRDKARHLMLRLVNALESRLGRESGLTTECRMFLAAVTASDHHGTTVNKTPDSGLEPVVCACGATSTNPAALS